MREPFAGDDSAEDARSDNATDRELRDTFGVTEEGLRALTERAKADKARDALHPRTVLRGRAGSHAPHPAE